MGALLFEMLTGLPPFYNKDTNQMYESIISDTLVFPPELGKDVTSFMSQML
jgi:serine/threonine protein kinase